MADLTESLKKSKPLPFSIVITNAIFRIYTTLIRFVYQLTYGAKGGTVPPITDPILLESATSLATKIRKKELTSVQVMETFIRRIQEVNPILNCCVDQRFEEALKEAAEADKLISSATVTEDHLKKHKPFLGIPISTKDCIAVKGLLHSAGLYVRRDFRAKENADAIELMKNAGAIPFCITNVSEMCMWWESSNSVHGRTSNPYDTNRIVGGSSGGEGCIQASAASAFGLGSDIGGSIRMPAFFNGVFGHKPSRNIVSNKGQFPMPYSKEQESFLALGPICRHAEDLKPMLHIIAGENADLLKLDKPVNLKEMNFFYQEDDGGGRLVSPVDIDLRHIMKAVVSHLEISLKVKVENLQIEEFRQSAAIWFANMKDDSGMGFDHQLANLNGTINSKTELLKWFLCASKHTLIGLLTAIVEKFQPQYGSDKYHYLVEKKNKLRDKMQKLLGENGVLLYPTHPTVAPYHNEPILRPLNFSYTGIINVLGFPATAIPLGKLGKEGVPLGIQVIANFNQDRLCLAVAEELEKAFGGWTPPNTKI